MYISSTRIGEPFLLKDVKVSKDKNIDRWGDWENLIHVRWNRIKNRDKDEECDKTLSELKTVENISKNMQSFLKINPVQKEGLLSHKLREHAYEY